MSELEEAIQQKYGFEVQSHISRDLRRLRLLPEETPRQSNTSFGGA
ncbi:MAG: hypothetical protein U0105_05290 [Candidatus Obscuribacterales bacterium]